MMMMMMMTMTAMFMPQTARQQQLLLPRQARRGLPQQFRLVVVVAV